MADNDTEKDKVRRSLFPTKQSVVHKSSAKWYRKNQRTMNAKLRQAILDVLPLDPDITKEKADFILSTIFWYIAECLAKGESVTIPTLGKFYVYRTKPLRRNLYGKKICIRPSKNLFMFKSCARIHRALEDKEDNGNSGTDQGT